jgi:ABC-type branched-subunit amino acid transport system permease subunit
MDKVRAQMGVARERTSAGLERAGIDVPTALKSLMLASIIGILAGFFGMVSPKHALIFAGAAIALNGFTYSFFKREEDIAGLTVSLASGLVAAIFWLILTAISGNDYTHTNFVQTIVFGLIFGLIGFGWLALLRALPEDLFANKTEPPSKPE